MRELLCRISWLTLASFSACSSEAEGEGGESADGKVARYELANGTMVDCVALRASPPGDLLLRVLPLTADPADALAALEACLAEGPHLCDRAWVGHAMFAGLSMAVADSVAPPIEQRARWFGDACRAMTPEDQACLVSTAGGPKEGDACIATKERLREAMGRAQMADGAAHRTPAHQP